MEHVFDWLKGHYEGRLEMNGDGDPNWQTTLLGMVVMIGAFYVLCKLFENLHELIR